MEATAVERASVEPVRGIGAERADCPVFRSSHDPIESVRALERLLSTELLSGVAGIGLARTVRGCPRAEHGQHRLAGSRVVQSWQPAGTNIGRLSRVQRNSVIACIKDSEANERFSTPTEEIAPEPLTGLLPASRRRGRSHLPASLGGVGKHRSVGQPATPPVYRGKHAGAPRCVGVEKALACHRSAFLGSPILDWATLC